MIEDQKTIISVLSNASVIFYKGENELVWLVYEEGKLQADNSPDCRSVSEISKLIFHYDIKAWEVRWRIGEQ